GAQVAANGGEVKGRNSQDKAIQRTVFQTVPNTSYIVWLLMIDLFCIVHVEAQEVCQFASGVDLSLECSLALAQHGSCVDLITVRTCNQVCSLQEDGSSVFPRHGFPSFFCFHSSVHGHAQFLFASDAVFSQHMLVVVRHDTSALVFG